MFRVECFVEDSKLGRFLMAVNGLCHMTGPPQPATVEIAVKSKGNGALRSTARGSLHDTIVDAFKPGTRFNIREVEVALTQAGYKRASWNSVAQQLRKEGLLKDISKGVYEMKEARGGKKA